MIERPQRLPISKKVPWSHTDSMIERILYTRRGSRGTIEMSASSRRWGLSPVSTRSGSSSTLDGRYDRNCRARSNASASLSTTSSMAPLAVWMSAWPSSSLPWSPSDACSTSAGPAIIICAVSRTITE